MIQEFKKRLRYHLAVLFGSLETDANPDICEVTCQNCEMPTAIDSTVYGEQSCYFCNQNPLVETPMQNSSQSSPVSAPEPTATDKQVTNSNSEPQITA